MPTIDHHLVNMHMWWGKKKQLLISFVSDEVSGCLLPAWSITAFTVTDHCPKLWKTNAHNDLLLNGTCPPFLLQRIPA